MATALPRFQPLGVQFADLPRVSTASQEAGAQMQQIQAQQFDQIGRAVDRMTAFFQEKAVSEAQKQGLRYAVENPLTKEQVDVALGTEQGLKIKGAGTIFQESYEQAQGQMLSSELQVEGQRQISALAAAIMARSIKSASALSALGSSAASVVTGAQGSVAGLVAPGALPHGPALAGASFSPPWPGAFLMGGVLLSP